MLFTNHEALALALGLLSVEQLSLAEIAPAVQSARAKLARVLPLELSEQFQALAETIALDRNRNPMASSSAVILTLSRAVRLRQRTHLVYQGRHGPGDEAGFRSLRAGIPPGPLVCRGLVSPAPGAAFFSIGPHDAGGIEPGEV